MDFMVSALTASSMSFFTCFLVPLEIQIAEIATCDLGILGVESTQLADSSPSISQITTRHINYQVTRTIKYYALDLI